MARVSRDEFVLTFDGPATEDHRIDAGELATALFGLSSTFRRAQQIVDPDAEPLSLAIQATDEGSFEVHMALVQQSLIQQAVEFLTGSWSNATVNAASLAGIVFGTFKFLRWLGGRGYTASESKQPGKVTITRNDGVTIEIDASTIELCEDDSFRRALERTVEPLARDGITEMRFSEKDDGAVIEEIPEAERAFYDAPLLDSQEPTNVLHEEVMVEPLGVEFDWRKWRVDDGQSAFFAAVADEGFRDKVDKHAIRIGAGDLLKVKMRTDQYVLPSGKLRSTRTIEKVLGHVVSGQQGMLTFDGE